MNARPTAPEPATCKSCKAAIVWAKTEKGASMPCDWEPAFDGGFYLFIREGFVEAISTKSDHQSALRARSKKQLSHHSHFVTCPKRDQHRRPR